MLIRACVWKMTSNQEELLKLLLQVIKDSLEEKIIPIDDLSSVEPQPADYIIYFGAMAGKYADEIKKKQIWELPDLCELENKPENKAMRKRAFEKLKAIIEFIKNDTAIEEKKICVETEDKVTIGRINSDICITEQEAKYLKQIRDLLGGGKMVIQKGDLRIEVESEKK